MDEAHEWSLHTDVLFGILKNISSNRTDFKLIITSATMNSQKFSNFFDHAPIYFIPGRTFPVQINYCDSLPDDYVDSIVKKVLEIHLKEESGDILIFLTGREDIDYTCFLIE